MNLSESKELLQQKREELSLRISAIKRDFAEGRSADFAEQATETENDDVLKNLEFEAATELKQVNQALKRIADGDYGYCEKCGKLINPERLNILPYAIYCINCAE